MKKGIKYSLYGLLALIVFLIVAIPLIPVDSYRGEIEKQISEALSVEVSLGDIALTSLPQPGLVVENIRLSADEKEIITVGKILLVPKLSSLLSDTPVVRKIHLSGIDLRTDQLSHLTNDNSTGSEASSPPSIVIKKITGDQCRLIIDEKTTFGPFEFDLKLGEQLELDVFDLSLEEQVFKLNVKPEKENYAIQLQAKNWAPPLEPRIEFTSLQIDALLINNQRFHAKDINAVIYEGNLNGNLIVDWKSEWSVDSHLKIDSLNLGELLNQLDNHSLDGTASSVMTIKASAPYAEQLADQYRLTGDIQVVNGHLYNTDLEEAARSFGKEWKAGGQTPFDEFKTHADIDATTIKLTNLSLTSSALGAEGHLNIHEQTNLEGEISVGVNDTAGLISMPLMVAGIVGEPKVRPTDSALAGGAVGTVILGPGVGTAVGVKTGEFFSKIGGLFSSDDKKKEENKDSSKDEDSTADENDSEF